jgi:hypothetical protein
MNKSESIMKLAEALSKAQGEMPAVMMDATNPFLHNKYASLGAVISTSKEALSKHGLSFTQLVFNDDSKVGVETILMHSSGEWMSEVLVLPVGDVKGLTLAQVVGSVITYLRRYSLSAILGLYTDEDDDGNGKKDDKESKSASKKTESKTTDPDVGELQKQIVAKCTILKTAKHPTFMDVLKKADPSCNPNKIKDVGKLKELLKELNSLPEVKPQEETKKENVEKGENK